MLLLPFIAVSDLCLFLAVPPLVGLWSVNVAFPGHAYFLLDKKITKKSHDIRFHYLVQKIES